MSKEQKIRQKIADTQSRLKSLVDEYPLDELVEDKLAQLKTTIKKYPTESVLVGLGIGFVLGKLFSSSEEDE